MLSQRVPRGVTPERPGPGQESVWDYPRPPRAEVSSERVVVRHAGVTVAEASTAVRVLETSHPPTYYLPPDSFRDGVLREVGPGSTCEFKGTATYFDVVVDGPDGPVVVPRVAWAYPRPTRAFEVVRDHVALYPGLLDEVTLDGERVRAQEGGFYGGWVTDRVVGPFKGPPGTWGW